MSKIKIPTNSVPAESSLSGLKIAAFSLCPQWRREREGFTEERENTKRVTENVIHKLFTMVQQDLRKQKGLTKYPWCGHWSKALLTSCCPQTLRLSSLICPVSQDCGEAAVDLLTFGTRVTGVMSLIHFQSLWINWKLSWWPVVPCSQLGTLTEEQPLPSLNMKNKHLQFSVFSFGLLSAKPVEETIREYPDGNFSRYDFQLVLPFKHLKHQLLRRKNSSNCQIFTIHYIHLSMYTHTHTHKIYHIKF